MENPIKMDDLGVPHGTTIFGNIHFLDTAHTQTHKHTRKPTAGGPQDEGLEKVTPALNMAMVTISM